jgi:hypothetical protein
MIPAAAGVAADLAAVGEALVEEEALVGGSAGAVILAVAEPVAAGSVQSSLTNTIPRHGRDLSTDSDTILRTLRDGQNIS